MRKFRIFELFQRAGAIGLLAMLTQPAFAEIGSYLRPESRFPSGMHKREWLEARTKETRMQRWFRVTTEGSYGWVAEDHVLTALKMTSIARTTREEPDRFSPSLDSLRDRRIQKDSQVVILEIAGSWARVRVLGDDAPNHDSWMLNESLKRDPGNQIAKGVTIRETAIRATPGHVSVVLDRFDAFENLAVLRTQMLNGKMWIEVQLESGPAWVDRADVWLSVDVADGIVRSLEPSLELRSSPHPASDIVKRLKGTEALKVVDAKYLRWGRVKVPEHGFLWWPISDDVFDQPGFIPPMKLSTTDLMSRSLYDMALSESIPGLRFASAKGIFKSRDGKTWAKIAKFEDKNYPIAIAKNGTLFVGPYVSRDNGENFDQWIRWDRLVETVKLQTGTPPARLRLSSVVSRNNDGSEVDLILDVGRSKPIRVQTKDRGLNWDIRGS